MKKKKSVAMVLVTAMAMMLIGCGGAGSAPKEQAPAEKTTLTIAAAISMTDAMNELIGLYEKQHTNVTFKTNYAASGTLQTQIEEGAPVDVFVSAGKKQMDALAEKNLLANDTRVNLLKNTEVVIVPKDSTLQTDALNATLAADVVKKIALGDPASVPAGKYATEAIAYYKLDGMVGDRVVYATNVRQVLDWVANGDVDAGVVYKTDALTEPDKVRVLFTIPEESHAPIVYPAAVLAKSTAQEEAKAFLTWLQGEEAAKVIEKYGFATSEA